LGVNVVQSEMDEIAQFEAEFGAAFRSNEQLLSGDYATAAETSVKSTTFLMK